MTMVGTSSESVCKCLCSPFILVDPCPTIPAKTVVKTIATIACVAMAPSGISNKLAGAVIGHVFGEIIADKVL